jgi:uroporphyrin-III C-methyltransferase/precorrin-2 dehydrogenase/sirohydrochlorin ferrochelatase
VNGGYPLLLDLSGRRVLVVGGGAVGARRAAALADAGAQVEVVAPSIVAAISGDDRISVTLRGFSASDLAGAWLVQACTGVAAVDAAVAAGAEAAGIWCVQASSAAESAAWTPAVARAGDVIVAVNADRDPVRAKTLRDAISLLLSTGELRLRRHRARADSGRVALVGGGPGNPDLITVRGRRLLAEADVVVVDRLAPRALLDELAADVELIEAGKTRDNHVLQQEQINDVLVSLAQQGKFVVRLKGGDPFVFGRGGEEMLACVQAGVPCEVVPGVTSAIAVPAAAGIPVTHRAVARQFTVVAAHEDRDLSNLASVEGTLVLLMGATRVERIAVELVTAGRSPSTPVAVVESGTTAKQRTTRGTLATIGELARTAGVRAPAIVVVGEVAELHDVLNVEKS